MPVDDRQVLAVHENTLIPLQEAKARQAAEEERSRRQWEEQLAYQSLGKYLCFLFIDNSMI